MATVRHGLRAGIRVGCASLVVGMLMACQAADGGSRDGSDSQAAGGEAPPPVAGGDARCGDFAWCDASLDPDVRADMLLAEMTLDEKISLLAGDDLVGVTGFEGTHTGTSDGIERLGIPTIFYSDGPMGVRSGPGTAFPSPLALAATWDPELAFRYGATVATEARHKGNDVLYAPTVNIMRLPQAGRSFEGFGEDPHLTSRIGVRWIQGAQSTGVVANVKHYAANNQEGIGAQGPEGVNVPLGVALIGNRSLTNAVIDERTLREIYLPAFEAVVKEAGVGTVMCGYNRVNGEYACASDTLLNRILRDDWGFEGYVLADYAAATNTAASFNNGLDFEPWPGVAYNPAALTPLIASGVLSEAELDEKIRNILRTHFAFGVVDRPAFAVNPDGFRRQEHADFAGEVEQAAITLLKNDGILPLRVDALQRVAIIGEVADTFQRRGGSAGINPYFFNTPREILTQRLEAAGIEVVYDDGSDDARAAEVAAGSDVALVFVADRNIEGADRLCLSLNCPGETGDQDGLIEAVAAANNATVVVLETGAPVLTPWRAQLSALVSAWIPGVDAGNAITAVLLGDVDPGGRLPATFPDSADDLPTANNPFQYPGVAENADYSEGLLIGYRWYDARAIEPAYPFGHGLSYTDFAYSDLAVSTTPDGGARVTFQVRNTGTRAGSDVAQVYLALPDDAVMQPPQALKGFAKVQLAPGTSRQITIELPPRAFAYWDVAGGDWAPVPGCSQVRVGRSSRDIRLEASGPCVPG